MFSREVSELPVWDLGLKPPQVEVSWVCSSTEVLGSVHHEDRRQLQSSDLHLGTGVKHSEFHHLLPQPCKAY